MTGFPSFLSAKGTAHSVQIDWNDNVCKPDFFSTVANSNTVMAYDNEQLLANIYHSYCKFP